MEDLVSIIVASYNHAEYLKQRLDSLLKQSYRNLEIMVVDDCSKDESLNVLEGYKKYPNIRIVALERNIGIANVYNLGASLSRGEYIMFAECDDFNDSKHVEILLGKLRENENAGVAYCRSNIVDSKGKVLTDDFRFREMAFKKLCKSDTLIPKHKMQRFLLSTCVIPNMSSALIRKKYFNLVKGFCPKYKACADWDFWCRIAQRCDFYYVCSPLNNFRFHMTNVKKTFRIKLRLCEIFNLLYNAFCSANLNFAERYNFRINMGFIWADSITCGFKEWIQDFIPIWHKSLRYEKLGILYLALGFIKLASLMTYLHFSNVKNNFNV